MGFDKVFVQGLCFSVITGFAGFGHAVQEEGIAPVKIAMLSPRAPDFILIKTNPRLPNDCEQSGGVGALVWNSTYFDSLQKAQRGEQYISFSHAEFSCVTIGSKSYTKLKGYTLYSDSEAARRKGSSKGKSLPGKGKKGETGKALKKNTGAKGIN